MRCWCALTAAPANVFFRPLLGTTEVKALHFFDQVPRVPGPQARVAGEGVELGVVGRGRVVVVVKQTANPRPPAAAVRDRVAGVVLDQLVDARLVVTHRDQPVRCCAPRRGCG